MTASAVHGIGMSSFNPAVRNGVCPQRTVLIGSVIVREAGGRSTHLDGRPGGRSRLRAATLGPHRPGAVATNGRLQDALPARLAGSDGSPNPGP